jgi:hypothetical protein
MIDDVLYLLVSASVRTGVSDILAIKRALNNFLLTLFIFLILYYFLFFLFHS